MGITGIEPEGSNAAWLEDVPELRHQLDGLRHMLQDIQAHHRIVSSDGGVPIRHGQGAPCQCRIFGPQVGQERPPGIHEIHGAAPVNPPAPQPFRRATAVIEHSGRPGEAAIERVMRPKVRQRTMPPFLARQLKRVLIKGRRRRALPQAQQPLSARVARNTALGVPGSDAKIGEAELPGPVHCRPFTGHTATPATVPGVAYSRAVSPAAHSAGAGTTPT